MRRGTWLAPTPIRDVLHPLTTRGPRIVSSVDGSPVLLRGVNRSGLEYAHPVEGDFLRGAAVTETELDTIASGWGANIVRVPFNQQRVLQDANTTGAGYLTALDRVVAGYARRQAYVLIALQWLDSEIAYGIRRDGKPNRVAPLPNLQSIEVWRRLAARYRDEPAVLFDLFTEPHNVVRDRANPHRDDRNTLIGITDQGTTYAIESGRVTIVEWQAWARHLIRAVRDEHPRALIFVSGVDWAYDLRGFPLRESAVSDRVIDHLVYSTHVYPWRGGPSRFTNIGTVAGRTPTWRAAFGDLAGQWPVFAGEWGGEAVHIAWATRLCAYMDRLGMGWTAWSWSDRPYLVENFRNGAALPTAFGSVVQDALRGNRRAEWTFDRRA